MHLCIVQRSVKKNEQYCASSTIPPKILVNMRINFDLKSNCPRFEHLDLWHTNAEKGTPVTLS